MDRKDWKIKRIAKEIKLKDIANAIGISDSYLCKYEKNHCNLPHSIVLKYQNFIDNYKG